MSFNVVATEPFERKLKKLSKKHKSLKTDLLAIIEELVENPTLGTSIRIQKPYYLITKIQHYSHSLRPKRRLLYGKPKIFGCSVSQVIWH